MIAPVITIDSESRTYSSEKKKNTAYYSSFIPGGCGSGHHSKSIGPTVIDYELDLIDLIIDKTFSAYCMELGGRFPSFTRYLYYKRNFLTFIRGKLRPSYPYYVIRLR